jgi:uncharacterized protein (DUF302 family)
VSEEVAGTSGLVVKTSSLSVSAVVERLTHLVAEKGMKLFAVNDHSGEDRRTDQRQLRKKGTDAHLNDERAAGL